MKKIELLFGVIATIIGILMYATSGLAMEYTSNENMTVSVTNATTGAVITNAVCNITISNSSGVQQSYQPMNNSNDGTYYWHISGLGNTPTEKYLAKANCSVAGNEWTTWGYFTLVDEYATNKTESIQRDLTESIIIYPTGMDVICPGETVIAEWRFYDLKANELSILSWQDCNVSYYNDTGDKIHITNDFLTESVSGNDFIVAISESLTPAGNTSLEYAITCEDVTVTNTYGQNVPLELEQHFIFTEECNIASRNPQNLTAADVWESATRNLTYTNTSDMITPTDVWGHTTRTLTQNITQNDTAVNATAIWTYTNRSLTEFPFAVNLTQSAFDTLFSGVWTYATRSLTTFGTLVADIWAYATRTLTIFTQAQLQQIWNHTERNLTTGQWGTVDFLNDTQASQLENATGSINTTIYDNSTMNIILPADAI